MTSSAVLGLNMTSVLLSQALAIRNRKRAMNSSKVQSGTEVQEETTLKGRSAKFKSGCFASVLNFCIFNSVLVGFWEIFKHFGDTGFQILMNSEAE